MRRKVRAAIVCAVMAAVLLIGAIPVSAAAAWSRGADGNYYNDEGTVIPDVTAKGMDVSTYQGNIDWEKVKRLVEKGELDFVILRCGYGSDYEDQDDEKFHRNAQACEKYGIPFGVYLFSYALDADDARSEAEHTVRLIKDYTLSYPVYYDLEGSNYVGEKDASFYKTVSKVYCDAMQALGYEVGIYSSRSWFTGKLATIDYDGNGYQKWVAEFGSRLKYDGGFDIWQCTSNGSVDGVSGRVDLSFSFMEKRTVNHTYVTFDPNTKMKVTVPSGPLHAEKGQTYGYLPVPECAALRFEGWFTEKEGGERVTEDTVVPVAGKQILYAHWSDAAWRIGITSGEGIGIANGTQSVKPFTRMKDVTLTPEGGQVLPDALDLGEGITYTKKSDGSAVISGTPKADLVVSVPSAPKGSLPAPFVPSLTLTPASFEGADGVIAGLDEGDEYSADGGKTWKKVTAAEAENGVGGLKGGEYLVRHTDARHAGGESASVTLLSRAAAPDEASFPLIRPMTDTAPLSLNGLNETYEYRINGGEWQVGTVRRLRRLDNWTNLQIRTRATAEQAASEPLSIVVCDFDASKAIDLTKRAVTGLAPKTAYLIDGVEVKSGADGTLPFDPAWYGRTVTLSNAPEGGVEFTLSFPAKAALPEGLTAVNETVRGKEDGQITGIREGMEYSVNRKTWQKIGAAMEENGLTGLAPRDYYVRVRAADGVLESDAVKLTVGEGKMLTVTYRVWAFPGGSPLMPDLTYELKYGQTLREIPALPLNPDAIMEQSGWDRDLTGVEITEDIVVNAVYEPTEEYLERVWWEKNGTAVTVLSVIGGLVVLSGIAAAVIAIVRAKKRRAEEKKKENEAGTPSVVTSAAGTVGAENGAENRAETAPAETAPAETAAAEPAAETAAEEQPTGTEV